MSGPIEQGTQEDYVQLYYRLRHEPKAIDGRRRLHDILDEAPLHYTVIASYDNGSAEGPVIGARLDHERHAIIIEVD